MQYNKGYVIVKNKETKVLRSLAKSKNRNDNKYIIGNVDNDI